MKSLVKFGLTVSLVATTLLSSWMGQTLKVLALPLEEVVQKLNLVPVFTIADEQGAPLVASGEDNTRVAGVFISPADAQEFVEQLKQDKPELADQVRVVPVSLGEIFEISKRNETQEDGLQFAYVPMESEVELARQVLTQAGQEYRGGVPLFVAKAGEEGGYITIQRENEQLIPFFFEKQQLETVIERFKQEKPELASTVVIEVIPLESILVTLENQDDEALRKILFVPTEESQEFVRQSNEQQQ